MALGVTMCAQAEDTYVPRSTPMRRAVAIAAMLCALMPIGSRARASEESALQAEESPDATPTLEPMMAVSPDDLCYYQRTWKCNPDKTSCSWPASAPQKVLVCPESQWRYDSDYLFAATRSLRRANWSPVSTVLLVPLTLVVDTALLPFSFLLGFFN